MSDDLRNPYSPPLAVTPTFVTRAARPAAKRPISAWIFMVFLAIMMLATVLPALPMAWDLATGVRRVNSVLGLFGWLAYVVGIGALLVALILAVHRARPWSRWVGLLLIVSFSAFAVLRHDTAHYASDAERSGAEFARYVIMPALFVWWAWAYAFTAKAKAYFARPAVDAE
jgi:hypothetical protein